ncbi:MAG TPA: LysM peptidoglycan-binding domain-containing protein [Bacilli bacterium]|nr:LysM peptidoglycan-binding domain-containing protein [Bacilli bacterium]
MKSYTVQKGDSLWKIAKMHGVALKDLIAANPQIANPDQIDVGMQIHVPGATEEAAPVETAVPGKSTPTPPSPDLMDVGVEGEEAAPEVVEQPEMATEPTPAAAEMPAPPPPSPAYPSVPKWEGLWKYVVKHGDTMFKIAKQVGVTLDQLKAANPQVPNPDTIYSGQVLNIPSSGLKPKGSNPGPAKKMTKEELTAPIAMPKEELTAPIAMPKEELTKPKEMVTMEKPKVTAPMLPMMPPAPQKPLLDVDANLQFAPHTDLNFQWAPHKENNINVQLQNQQQQQQAQMPATPHHSHNPHHGNPHSEVVAAQKQEMTAPMAMQQEQMMMPYHHPHHPMMMMYIPVSKKKKYHKHNKCHKKMKMKKKCGCHHHHHEHEYHQMMLHHHHMMMQMQHMGTYPRTFYNEEN